MSSVDSCTTMSDVLLARLSPDCTRTEATTDGHDDHCPVSASSAYALYAPSSGGTGCRADKSWCRPRTDQCIRRAIARYESSRRARARCRAPLVASGHGLDKRRSTIDMVCGCPPWRGSRTVTPPHARRPVSALRGPASWSRPRSDRDRVTSPLRQSVRASTGRCPSVRTGPSSPPRGSSKVGEQDERSGDVHVPVAVVQATCMQELDFVGRYTVAGYESAPAG